MDNVERLFSINYLSVIGLIKSSLYVIAIFLTLCAGINVLSPIPHMSFYFLVIAIFCLVIINILVWITVRIWNSIIWVKQNKINIAFAVYVEEKDQEIYLRLIKNFQAKLTEADKYSNFSIINLSSQRFRDSSEAENFAKKERINLLIWGDTEDGTVNNIDTTIFRFKLTYNFQISSSSIDEYIRKQQIFVNHISSTVVGRSWAISSDQTLPLMRAVSDNLTQIALYVIVRCLLTFGYIKLSYSYCKDLYEDLKNINKNSFAGYTEFKEIVKGTLIGLLTGLCYFSMRVDKNAGLAINYAQEVLRLDSNCYAALTIITVNQWLLGNEKESYQYFIRAKRVQPSNNINRVNEAFFALNKYNFKKAITMYHKIDSFPPDVDILPIIEFLDAEYEKKKNVTMIYASGYMNLHFADVTRGKRLLRTFLNKVDNTKEYTKYELLILDARRLIS